MVLQGRGDLEEVDVPKFWDEEVPRGLLSKHRPLGLYGDDAQFDQNQNKLIIFTINDVLATAKHSMRATWPLFVLREVSRINCLGRVTIYIAIVETQLGDL